MIIVKIKGGLGNQLFQYALAYKYSKSIGKTPLLDLSFYDYKEFSQSFRLNKFNLKYQINNYWLNCAPENTLKDQIARTMFYRLTNRIHPPSGIIYLDKINNPIEVLKYLPSNRQYLIVGWMQRPDLISDIRQDLSSLLQVKDEHYLNPELLFKMENSNSVAVHIRRGDMELNPNFKTLGYNYYKEAIIKIKNKVENPQFFIFSDEPEKARVLLIHERNCIYISENSSQKGLYATNRDFIDFALLRRCKHFIIANSTFSWWSAFLSNTDSVVIAPHKWYTNNKLQSDFEKAGMLPSKWNII